MDNIKRHVLFKSQPEEDWNLYEVKVVHYSRTYASSLTSLKFFEVHTDIELCSDEEDDSPSLLAPPAKKKRENPRRETPIELNDLSLNLDTENIQNVRIESQCSDCKENHVLLQSILEKVIQLTSDVKELKKAQSLVHNKVDIQKPDEFPLSAATDVVKLNNDLEDNNLFVQRAKYLGQYGGRDVNECTRRILGMLMTNSVARGFNWIGGFNKVGMKNLPKILQLIAVAVRQTEHNAKHVDVEVIVKRWLRTAADRGAGSRIKRKAVLTPVSQSFSPQNFYI